MTDERYDPEKQITDEEFEDLLDELISKTEAMERRLDEILRGSNQEGD